MKLGSLFSGYGGLDLGVQMALGEMSTAWVADIEPGPKAILTQRFPDAPNLGDITGVDWHTVEPVDVIAGGSPCQDLSMAGRRAGMKPGTRSGLWESMVQVISVLKPRLVVWENVLGALSAEAFSLSSMEPGPGRVGDGSGGPILRALGRVLGDLATLGYDARWHSVRAADVGAPHNRARVFVIAYPHESRSAQWGQSLASATQIPAAVIGDHLLPTPTSSEHTGAGHAAQGGLNLRTAVTLLPAPTAQAAKHLVDDRGPGTFDDYNLWSVVGRPDFGNYQPAIERWEHHLGRKAPASTQLNVKGKAQLSAPFVEWMMGLPEGWVTDVEISRAQQLRALGNGVVPQQAAFAITEMLSWAEVRAA